MNTTPSPRPGIASPPKESRWAGTLVKIIFILLAIVAVGAFVWAENARRGAVRQLEQTMTEFEELKNKTTQDSSQETANQVRANVAKLINIPLDPPPTVAAISDIDKLKESNEFFAVAQNGDYLILTGNRAILYNLEKNIILDVAPFRVNSPSPSPADTPLTTSPTPAR
jgi:hypothetical protein